MLSLPVYHNPRFVGYCWYDRFAQKPLFSFGHGLSYASFAYSALEVQNHLPDGPLQVKVRVQNTSARPGSEVVQLYVGLPGSAGDPPHQLKGFEKLHLEPGASQQVTFTLDPAALSAYDEEQKAWRLYPGEYTAWVGSSSRRLPLSQEFACA